MNPTASTEKLSLTLSRVIRARRPRVFKAFASVEEMKKWFGPEECHVIEGSMDFRQGGGYRLKMHTSDFGPADLVGSYQEIVRDQRIRLTWAWRNNPAMEPWGEMLVTLQFADHTEGTELTIVHQGLIHEKVRDGHSFGWNGSLDKLVTALAATAKV